MAPADGGLCADDDFIHGTRFMVKLRCFPYEGSTLVLLMLLVVQTLKMLSRGGLSMSNNSFIDLCVEGEALPEEIDDFVDQWHESDSDEPIFVYLGMTQQEYRLWVHDPDILPFVITARVQGRSIDDVIADLHELPMAARADSPAKAKFLMKWLKQAGV
jgi:hypothetical protein